MGRIRVMIVDDHEIVRRGLGRLLSQFETIDVVGEAENGAEALRLCGELIPDVILMDLVMPGMDGLAATQVLSRQFPHTHIIALSGDAEINRVMAALRAGAGSYLLKNVSINELAEAIQQAYEGKASMSPEATQALIDAVSQPRIPPSNFSERERAILRFLVQGLTNQEIAAQLEISLSTVKYHLAGLFTKLSVSKRAEAVAVAIKHNLV